MPPDIDLDKANESLEGAHPSEILRWAVDTFSPDLIATSSFQTQSLPLLHLISQEAPQVPIVFLETGYHFPETLEFRDEVVDRLELNLEEVRGDKRKENAARDGSRPLYRTNPDLCCKINKVDPLEEAMEPTDAWISGIRRDQSSQRASRDVVEPYDGGRYRVHPMIVWTRKDVEAYVEAHDIPRHPLDPEGFESIGCQPCTRRPPSEESPRSGRWPGRDKEECGLHTVLPDGKDEDEPKEGSN